MGTAAKFPLRRADVWVRQGGEETVLVTSHGSGYVVNETALAIWELCDGQTSPQEMIDAVCALCSVAYETAAHDVHWALAELDAAELIEWRVADDALAAQPDPDGDGEARGLASRRS